MQRADVMQVEYLIQGRGYGRKIAFANAQKCPALVGEKNWSLPNMESSQSVSQGVASRDISRLWVKI